MGKNDGYHVSASAEDYLEAIYLICNQKGVARSRDIMEHLSVSGPSVTEALQLLKKKDLVNYTPYEAITLTEQGECIAQDVLHRHVRLKEFLVEVLCVEEHVADEGACKMEHVVSEEIIDRMIRYRRFLQQDCKGKQCDQYLSFREYIGLSVSD